MHVMMSKFQGHINPRHHPAAHVRDLCQHPPCSGKAGTSAWIALVPAGDLFIPVPLYVSGWGVSLGDKDVVPAWGCQTNCASVA